MSSALSKGRDFGLKNVVRHLSGRKASFSRVSAADGALSETPTDRRGENFRSHNCIASSRGASGYLTTLPWYRRSRNEHGPAGCKERKITALFHNVCVYALISKILRTNNVSTSAETIWVTVKTWADSILTDIIALPLFAWCPLSKNWSSLEVSKKGLTRMILIANHTRVKYLRARCEQSRA